jgi:hypothetical protein
VSLFLNVIVRQSQTTDIIDPQNTVGVVIQIVNYI